MRGVDESEIINEVEGHNEDESDEVKMEEEL